MAEAAFYDIHCHALTLSPPSFLAFVETVRSRRMETLYAQARSPGFLAGSLFLKGGERVITAGGIFGTVKRVMDDRMEIEVANNVLIQVTRASISGVIDPTTGSEKK